MPEQTFIGAHSGKLDELSSVCVRVVVTSLDIFFEKDVAFGTLEPGRGHRGDRLRSIDKMSIDLILVGRLETNI